MRQRSAAHSALLGIVASVACGVPAAAPAPEPSLPLVARHWDQVCLPARGEPSPVFVHELVDTAVLSRELKDAGVFGEVTGALDIMVAVRRDGRISGTLAWSSTLPAGREEPVGRALSASLRPLEGLLADTDFRVRVQPSAEEFVELRPPLECMPHLVHEADSPPIGLPDTVRIDFGRDRVRPGRPAAAIRLSIDPDGRLVSVDSVAGPGEMVQAVRAFVGRLRFDPALRNGRPVFGTILQTYHFLGSGGPQ